MWHTMMLCAGGMASLELSAVGSIHALALCWLAVEELWDTKIALADRDWGLTVLFVC